jgi:serine/threonine protein kinase
MRLGSYEVLQAIGAGGMGEVYRARDCRLNRNVALKLLPGRASDYADQVAVSRARGARSPALDHPNIAAVHALEESGGLHYLVLELVPGESLAERLRRGPLRIEEVLTLAVQIASALEAALEKGIVHRDLKPANVMVTPDHRIKVLDFGLAKLMRAGGDASRAGAPTMTATTAAGGVIAGTPACMSPEQIRGEPADARSDIWAFGCVLYELLSGTPVFLRSSVAETIAAVLDAPPDWSKLPRPTLPAVRRVLRRSMEKNLADDCDISPTHESNWRMRFEAQRTNSR